LKAVIVIDAAATSGTWSGSNIQPLKSTSQRVLRSHESKQTIYMIKLDLEQVRHKWRAADLDVRTTRMSVYFLCISALFNVDELRFPTACNRPNAHIQWCQCKLILYWMKWWSELQLAAARTCE
jgi:hypothetical protein